MAGDAAVVAAERHGDSAVKLLPATQAAAERVLDDCNFHTGCL